MTDDQNQTTDDGPVQPKQTTGPTHRRRWAETPVPTSSRRELLGRWAPHVLVTLIVAIGGSLFGLLSIVSTKPTTTLMPIWTTFYADADIALHGPLETDRVAILSPSLFHTESPDSTHNASPEQLADQLKRLADQSSRQQLVIYISALALAAPDGEVWLSLGNVKSPSDAQQVSLTTVLKAVKNCPSTRKLLVLDICWPFVVPERGIQTDDVASRLQETLADLDAPGLTTICSCSAGQTAKTILSPRRSVFGYFFERGLLGAADRTSTANQNGRVSVQELSRYLTAVVDDYSLATSQTRQTPVCYGKAADFDLVACSTNPLPIQTDNQSVVVYPEWLHNAWNSRDELVKRKAFLVSPGFLGQFEQTILNAEMNWSRGCDPESTRSKLVARLTTLARQFNVAESSIHDSVRQTNAEPFRFVDVVDLPPSMKAEESVAEDKKTSGKAAATKAPSKADVNPKKQVVDAKKDHAEGKPLPSDADLDKTVTKLMSDFDSVLKTVPEAQQPASTKKLLDQFADATANVSDRRWIANLYRFAATQTTFRQRHLDVIDSLLEQRGLRSTDLFSSILAELAQRVTNKSDLKWDRPTIQLMLGLIADNELTADNLMAWPWTQALQKQACENRYSTETLFWHPQHVAADYFTARLKKAVDDQQRLQATQTKLARTFHDLDKGFWRLPQFRAVLTARPQQRLQWERAVKLVTQLKRTLIDQAPTSETKSNSAQVEQNQNRRLDDAFAESHDVQTSMQALLRPFSAEAVATKLTAAQRDDADTQQLARLELLLTTPFVSASDRKNVYQVVGKLASSLHREALDNQNTTTTFIGLSEHQLTESLSAAEQRKRQRENFETTISSLTGPTLPALDKNVLARCDSVRHQQTFAKADWRHSANLYSRLSQDSPYAGLYKGLAQRYQNLIEVPIPSKLTLAETAHQCVLSKTQPALQIRIPYLTHDLPSHAKPSNLRFASSSVTGPQVTARSLPLVNRSIAVNAVELKRNLNGRGGGSAAIDVSMDDAANPQTLQEVAGFFVEFENQQETQLQRIDFQGLDAGPTVDVFASDASPTSEQPRLSSRIRLRPSQQQQPVRLYVKNLRGKTQNLTVAIGKTEKSFELEPYCCQAVRFPGKPPKANEPLPDLKGGLAVQVRDSKSNALLLEKVMPVEVAAPREYVEILSASFKPFSSDRNRLEIWLRAKDLPPGPPCIARLELSPESIPNLVSVAGGRLKAELNADGSPCLLYAEDLKLREGLNENGTFDISVDGVPRTFRFKADFARQGTTTTPTLTDRAQLKIDANQTGLAGPGFSVALQPINVPSNSQLHFSIRKPGASLNYADIDRHFSTPYQTKIGFSVATGGDLLFAAQIKDWQLELDATGLVGQRDLHAEVLVDGHRLLERSCPVILDDAPPSYVRFVRLPDRVPASTDTRIDISAVSELTGIRSVGIFVGQPQDGKLPDKAQVVPASRSESDRQIWSALVKLPPKPGPLSLTVVATNGAGLKTMETRSVDVVPAKDLNTGQIRGQVFEGVRRQPDLVVTLINSTGATVSQTKSTFDGRFQFDNVPAGLYSVRSEKPATQRAGNISVRVLPGRTVGGDLSLSL